MRTRLKIPDWLKGVAILLVVYGHITHVGSFSFIQKKVVEVVYTFHIPIFLILSGFFYDVDTKPIEAAKKLFSRIFRPYLIFVSLYLIGLILIRNFDIPTSNSAPKSILDFIEIIFLYPKGAYWFLHSLILIQFCLIFSNIIIDKTNLDKSNLHVLILYSLTIFCGSNLLQPRIVFYFLLGIIINFFTQTIPESYKTSMIVIITIVLLARTQIYSFSIIQISWVMAIIILLSGVGKKFETTFTVSAFAWLGRNSLSILVLHSFFIVILKPISAYTLNIDNTGLTYSLLVLSITILGSMLVTWFFDVYKFTIYLFGVKRIYSKFIN